MFMFVLCYSLCNQHRCGSSSSSTGSCSGVLVVVEGSVPAPVPKIDQAVICNGKSVV